MQDRSSEQANQQPQGNSVLVSFFQGTASDKVNAGQASSSLMT